MEGDDIATRIAADDRFTVGPLRRRKTDLLTRRVTDRVELVPVTVEDAIRRRAIEEDLARMHALRVAGFVTETEPLPPSPSSRPSLFARLHARFRHLWVSP